METTYHTLQTFLTHTEAISYILIVLTLIGVAGFWIYLTGRDFDDD